MEPIYPRPMIIALGIVIDALVITGLVLLVVVELRRIKLVNTMQEIANWDRDDIRSKTAGTRTAV